MIGSLADLVISFNPFGSGMTRSPRSGSTSTAIASTPSEHTFNKPAVEPIQPVAGPSGSRRSSTAITSIKVDTPISQRKSSRVRRPSTSTTLANSSTPSTPLSLTPVPTPITASQPVASSSKPPPPSRQPVDFKAHALRSVIGGNERVSCPFPGQYGGRDKCGVMEDEEGDEILMSICAACAAMVS